ncbi:MAG: cytidine deaminase [Flavobacteriaceae bacterium]|nr:MAG: cytidine deaminase [Flavobacteriaceae bacterium]
MKKMTISPPAIIYDELFELSGQERNLLTEALKATKKAYAPYSKFKVGTALLLENNQIITGSNQENAAYPSGMCAERVAVWKAGTDYPNIKIKKIAITATSLNTAVNKPVSPCGGCRQTLLEYEINQKEPIAVLFRGETGKIVKVASVASLLPFSFDASFL